VVSDDAARTADGRLFHARGAATENDRSPRVDRLDSLASRPHRLHAVHSCGLLLQMSHVAWSVCLHACLSVRFANGQAVQKRLN